MEEAVERSALGLTQEQGMALMVDLARALQELYPGWDPRPGWELAARAGSEEELLAMLGADPEETYAVLDQLLQLLAEVAPLYRGEPRRDRGGVVQAICRYIMAHAGSVRPVEGVEGQFVFSPGFRQMVRDLQQPGGPAEGMSLEELAPLVDVSVETLEGWFREPELEPPGPPPG